MHDGNEKKTKGILPACTLTGYTRLYYSAWRKTWIMNTSSEYTRTSQPSHPHTVNVTSQTTHTLWVWPQTSIQTSSMAAREQNLWLRECSWNIHYASRWHNVLVAKGPHFPWQMAHVSWLMASYWCACTYRYRLRLHTITRIGVTTGSRPGTAKLPESWLLSQNHQHNTLSQRCTPRSPGAEAWLQPEPEFTGHQAVHHAMKTHSRENFHAPRRLTLGSQTPKQTRSSRQGSLSLLPPTRKLQDRQASTLASFSMSSITNILKLISHAEQKDGSLQAASPMHHDLYWIKEDRKQRRMFLH